MHFSAEGADCSIIAARLDKLQCQPSKVDHEGVQFLLVKQRHDMRVILRHAGIQEVLLGRIQVAAAPEIEAFSGIWIGWW